MVRTWQETGYERESTGDGSPTLRQADQGESMHHSGGALEETAMIYGAPLRELYKVRPEGRFLSMGLGLGYVELMATGEALKAGARPRGDSYEIVVGLRDAFVDWLNEAPLGDEVAETLNEVATRVSAQVGVPAVDLRRALGESLRAGEWVLRGALTLEDLPDRPCELILYDAFSSKTSPNLWEPEFLEKFMVQATAPDCLFTSYACNGVLKRTLKAANFVVFKRAGFKGKRNSTVALRGAFDVPTSLTENSERLGGDDDPRFGIRTN